MKGKDSARPLGNGWKRARVALPPFTILHLVLSLASDFFNLEL